MARPKTAITDYGIPLLKRPAHLGVLALFRSVAEQHGIDYAEIFAARDYLAVRARRHVCFELRRSGHKPCVIAWVLGLSSGDYARRCCAIVARELGVPVPGGTKPAPPKPHDIVGRVDKLLKDLPVHHARPNEPPSGDRT